MAEAQNNSAQDRGGFTSLRDMFDGGGPGRSGERFEGGGILSSIGNAFGSPREGGFDAGRMAGSLAGGAIAGPFGGLLGGLIGQGMGRGFGYTDAAGNVVSPRMDMMDGGGRGMAGDTFQGGLLSSILNAMNIRPMGYNARQAAMAEQASSVTPQVTQRAVAPAVQPRPMPRPTLPPAPMVDTSTPMQPGMNVMPDGEAFLRQNIAVVPALRGPSVDMPMASDPRFSRSRPDVPLGFAGRAMTPYEEMLLRFQQSGNPIMTTERGSLRPVGILPQ